MTLEDTRVLNGKSGGEISGSVKEERAGDGAEIEEGDCNDTAEAGDGAHIDAGECRTGNLGETIDLDPVFIHPTETDKGRK